MPCLCKNRAFVLGFAAPETKGLPSLYRSGLVGHPWWFTSPNTNPPCLACPDIQNNPLLAWSRDATLFALALHGTMVLKCLTGRQAIREWSGYTCYPLFLAALWYGFTASKLILFTEEVLTQSKSKQRDSMTPQEWSGFPTNEGR